MTFIFILFSSTTNCSLVHSVVTLTKNCILFSRRHRRHLIFSSYFFKLLTAYQFYSGFSGDDGEQHTHISRRYHHPFIPVIFALFS